VIVGVVTAIVVLVLAIAIVVGVMLCRRRGAAGKHSPKNNGNNVENNNSNTYDINNSKHYDTVPMQLQGDAMETVGTEYKPLHVN
jgi:hypothetical protein